MQYRVVSGAAGLFGSSLGGFWPKVDKISGLIWAWDVLFVSGAQKYNQNNFWKEQLTAYAFQI